ncbi:LOW QUALITY PROTEIN: hypothetical protein GQ55_9G110900 [Panicum hallii var. hallii]|uniref:Uncharacterized protein n=1 Tax=Panicum hallii var. hallii TaxID=1504633 RepID=A0A2T7C1V8_9POAL|nr:LOW QUALITY PROTEIN: hypothetical protein GQ55_9G110900 [Panicum hallii var. hallii]
MELSGCKALLLAALIIASSRLLHGPAGCSACGVPGSGASRPGRRGRRRGSQAARRRRGAAVLGPRRARVLPGRSSGEVPPGDAGGAAGSRRREDGGRPLALESPARVRTIARVQVSVR